MTAKTGDTLIDRRPRWIKQVAVLLHAAASAYFICVFIWHVVSPKAKRLPGYFKFGWFYRHLTFCTFTLQLIQLCMATISDLMPSRAGLKWRRVEGRMAVVAVCGASTLTTLYYAIRMMDSAGLDNPETRVGWISLTVHVWNSVIAWTDILVSFPRFFDFFDLKCVVGYTVGYSSWLLAIKLLTDEFPYPFLNRLPPLVGWMTVCCVGCVLMLMYFCVGWTVLRVFGQERKDVTS